MLASAIVNDPERASLRGLVVLADGVEAAFAAGAVAELARAGAVWRRGFGAGLGAQVAVLAVLGEAVEAERRWLREAETGCQLLRSRIAAARERLGPEAGVTVTPDPWTMDGWLDPAPLAEHLAPEMAALPARLSSAGACCAVAVEDLVKGEAAWVDLTGLGPEEAGVMLRAAATFPAGWGPEDAGPAEGARSLWGGVGAAPGCHAPWSEGGGAWDVVCGFPLPRIEREARGGSLFELIQRRQEARAGAQAAAWAASPSGAVLRVISPGAEAYRTWAGRENAELGVEYPLPWERNADLTAGLVRFGAFAARRLAQGSAGQREP